MAYPLLDNPYKHYYTTRNSRILGIVLHVTAGAEDKDMIGDDGSAWGTIRYSQSTSRPSSYHGIVDSDTIVDTLPDHYTAFHVINYNSGTLGLEISNLDARWAGKPANWVEATLRNAAAWCAPRVAKYGLPARLSSKAQVDDCLRRGVPFGFTYHSYLDPSRRIDPGKDFPFDQFIGYLGDDDMATPEEVWSHPIQTGRGVKRAVDVLSELDRDLRADLAWKSHQIEELQAAVAKLGPSVT